MYRFEGCVLDTERRELHSDNAPVHLEPQAYDLLVYLVEHRHRVVGKVELLEQVWGHGFLSESNLTTRVKEVRRAIGDDGTRQFAIRTIRGHGYRFVAPVEDESQTVYSSTLVGRATELTTTVALVARTPLVTLIGPGGVGKSALATAITDRAAPAFTDGTRTVELAPLDVGTALLPAIARRLDVVVDGDEDALRAIARRSMLVVLDNCEHLVDEVAQLVERLLATPGCKIHVLATSRVRLGPSAETLVAIGPLDAAAARSLFTARAEAVMPSWNPPTPARRIDQLLDGLDRLPLTIEMAAARLASMTFDDLEEEMLTGASLVQLQHRAPARRHRSLESVVEWSAALLSRREHEVFDGFSVFAGPVTAHEAGAVLDPADPAAIRSSLAALAECSLLVADLDQDTARYSMLATVRAVAHRRLTRSGRTDDVHRAHAEHVVDLVAAIDRDLRSPLESGGRVRLREITHEIRTAHRWAREHHGALASAMSASLFHAAHSSLWFEPADWADELLARDPADKPHGALLAAAGAASHRGALMTAQAHASAVLASDDPRLRAISFELLADVALYEGDLEAVHAAAGKLRRLGNELEDAHVTAFASIDASLAFAYGGDPQRAANALDDVDTAVLSASDAAWLAYAHGEASSTAGEPDAACHYRDAVQLGSSVGSRFVISVALTSLAVELTRTGEPDAALVVYRDALSEFRRHGNHTHALTAMRNLVGLFAALGDDRAAVVLGAAASRTRVRRSYGTEAAESARVLETVRTRVGDAVFDEWSAEGGGLDLDRALHVAIDLVDRHLR